MFVAASHQTGSDTRSMTRRSIKVGIWGEGWARAEDRALLDYDAARLPEGSPAETGGLTASSLPLLDRARWRTNGRAAWLSQKPVYT